jgi:K+-sensing histidine kinase KdpD
VGVLALRSIELGRFTAPDQRQLIEMAANQLALAIERDSMAEQAQKVLVRMEAESLRNSSMSSVSPDLRPESGTKSSSRQSDEQS